MRILFILKKNECYSFVSYTRRSSGLWNSTRFIAEALNADDSDIHAKIVEVHDNNDIDREVALFKPTIVVIEALWVVPEKFEILKKLHPTVKWFVHLHSGIPFLAQEGSAIGWIIGCAERGVRFIANSYESYRALLAILSNKELIFLPNVYLSNPKEHERGYLDDVIDIGCFGAIRPMKNQLIQAMASIRFAAEKGKKLRFHMNTSRIETGGEPVLKNIRNLFSRNPSAQLVEHGWKEPHEFLKTLNRHIDLGLQVSLTETFNVVSADYVSAGLPVVGSSEIPWLCNWSKAKVDSIDDIVRNMHFAWRHRWLIKWNQHNLKAVSENAQNRWINFVEENA